MRNIACYVLDWSRCLSAYEDFSAFRCHLLLPTHPHFYLCEHMGNLMRDTDTTTRGVARLSRAPRTHKSRQHEDEDFVTLSARPMVKMFVNLQGIMALQALFASSVLGTRLVDFQVAQPPPLPKDAKQCTIRLFE